MSDFQSYFRKHPDWKGKVVLIAGSVDDSKAPVIKRLEERGWNQTHNVWIGTNATKAYHVQVIPTTYVIRRDGNILASNPADVSALVNQELIGE
jgi:hypothetical protein